MKSINTAMLQVFHVLSQHGRSFSSGDVALPLDVLSPEYRDVPTTWEEHELLIPIVSPCRCVTCIENPSVKTVALCRVSRNKMVIIRLREHVFWSFETLNSYFASSPPAGCENRSCEDTLYVRNEYDLETYRLLNLPQAAESEIAEYNQSYRTGNEFYAPRALFA